jgi:lipopolysaccharide transport system ATP-binding protein
MGGSIVVENLTKCYQIGELQHTMLREALMGGLRRLVSRAPSPPRNLKRALDGVNLQVEPGEVVGIIGRNGAGKSTLLKVLSRITYPTSGRIDVQGRVGSLLEVGTGFHDELTGRENIYLNGSILGMKKREIEAAMDQIVAFADVGEFLDTPIKRYSSGMRMRLGFSVAAHLSTDILFVDEVLAVGDVGFQKKCLGTMRELGGSGRTILFVSHNMAAVENLCQRTIWIADGKVRADGPTRDVIRAYLSSFGAASSQSIDLATMAERRGSGAARLLKMEFLDSRGNEHLVFHSGDPLRVRFHYECFRDLPDLHFGLRIHTHLGLLVSDVHTWSTAQALPLARQGIGAIDLEIDFLNLMPGTYYLGAWISSFNEWQDLMENVATLEVEASDYYGTGRGIESRFGLVFFPFRWRPAALEAMPGQTTAGEAGESKPPTTSAGDRKGIDPGRDDPAGPESWAPEGGRSRPVSLAARRAGVQGSPNGSPD